MVDLKFVSSSGKEFDLKSFDSVKLQKGNFHKVTWTPEVTAKQWGTTINRFKKSAQEFECTFKFIGDPDKRKQQIDDFSYECEYDLSNMTPGRLYWNGTYEQYIEGYFNTSDTHPVDSGMTYTEMVSTFYAPFPFWIFESFLQIDPNNYEDLPQRPDVKGYPLDRDISYPYTYSYPMTGNAGSIEIVSPFGVDYHVEIYGPISDFFETIINDHVYKVNYPLRTGQKLIIDSRDTVPISKKCYVLNENGTETNVFDYRDPQSSLFERITGREAIIYFDKPYKLDLTLFGERSAPV